MVRELFFSSLPHLINIYWLHAKWNSFKLDRSSLGSTFSLSDSRIQLWSTCCHQTSPIGDGNNDLFLSFAEGFSGTYC